METEKALPSGNYNEKIKLDKPFEPVGDRVLQFWIFPDFILDYRGTKEGEVIMFYGKRKTLNRKFIMMKGKDKKLEVWLDFSGEFIHPIVFDGKPFLFETDSSKNHGALSQDEFIVRPPTEEELTGPHHIHFLRPPKSS